MAKMDGIFVNENGCIKYAQLKEVIRKLGSLSYESYRDLDVEWANCKAAVRDFINEKRNN